MASHTEENYLKAILRLSENKKKPVSTNAVAAALGTTPGSVSVMLGKLSAKGLTRHTRYYGVNLTPRGRNIALGIVRKHRLWEYFLVHKLHFPWDEVHEIAEQLEHIRSERLTDRLDVFLDRPGYDPHGDPIPDKAGKIRSAPAVKLSGLKVKMQAEVVGVTEQSPSFLKYLENISLRPGSRINLLEKFDYDKSIRIRIGRNAPVNISSKVSENILVTV